MSARVRILRDDDGLWVEACRCDGACRLHTSREPIEVIPPPFSGEALDIARRVQTSCRVCGFIVLHALEGAYTADHAHDRVAA